MNDLATIERMAAALERIREWCERAAAESGCDPKRLLTRIRQKAADALATEKPDGE